MQIDWSVFDEFPESTCYCRCGRVFRSHSKGVVIKNKDNGHSFTVLTRKKCPVCGRNDSTYRVSSDPEVMFI